MLIAGGTDHFVDDSAIQKSKQGVINIFGIDELRFISKDQKSLVIGASTTYSDIVKSKDVLAHLPMLVDACRLIGAMQIQSRATVGGNLATSSPVGDTLPVWLASDAIIECVSSGGTRLVPYEDFIVGYRQIDLKENEIIKAVHVPIGIGEKKQRFTKVGTRAFQSISKVMMAGSAQVSDGKIVDLRLALGAVAATPIRLKKTEKRLEGQTLSEAHLDKAGAMILEEITPIDDLRSTAEYRSEVAKNICLAFLGSLIGSPTG